MALRVIDGVPGAGKTFYAVWHLARHYFRKNDTTGVYELSKDCVIITNIDGFKPDHIDLRKEIEQAGDAARQKIKSSDMTERQKETALEKLDPVAEFFSYAYQEKYKEGKPQLVYVVDEAQRYFRKGADRVLKERKVFDYFEYHRHWGQDIYLVTQNVKKLPSDIVHLPEYIISARPRVRSIGKSFRYDWISSGEVIKKESRSRDSAVFALYKSMEASEQEKISNPVLKTVGVMLVVAVVVIFGGYKYYASRADQSKHASSAPGTTAVSPSQPSAVGGSYIPVGEPRRSAPPPPRYVVFVPLDSITSYSGNAMKTLYVWRGALLPSTRFPHETFKMAGQLYAVVDYELFDFMFGDGEDRPTDFIVQVASPEPLPGDGAKANTRSAARSDLSGEPARTGAKATKQG